MSFEPRMYAKIIIYVRFIFFVNEDKSYFYPWVDRTPSFAPLRSTPGRIRRIILDVSKLKLMAEFPDTFHERLASSVLFLGEFLAVLVRIRYTNLPYNLCQDIRELFYQQSAAQVNTVISRTVLSNVLSHVIYRSVVHVR